jgi:hypothetical protein
MIGVMTLLDDVRFYDSLGDHRTATAADHATSDWLARRLGEAGFAVDLQAFPAPLFVSGRCEIRTDGDAISAFPAWPVATTPEEGLSAPLVAHDAQALAGKIAFVRLTEVGASWLAPGVGERVMATARRGARAVVVATEGPTGEVIALNAAPGRFGWPIPVVLVGGRFAGRLDALAGGGAEVTLVSTGTAVPEAAATNVVARRPGRGGTIVVSTPKSGWFRCAGERGTGIAVFLDLGARLARETDADLLFTAFAGHELDYRGGAHFLKASAPDPAAVKVWLHVGANAAMQPLAVDRGRPSANPGANPGRRITANAGALADAARAFPRQAGYGPPVTMSAATALGELSLVHPVGYAAVAGLVGLNPLFHTPLDRAGLATTAGDLETVANAARAFLSGFAARNACS